MYAVRMEAAVAVSKARLMSRTSVREKRRAPDAARSSGTPLDTLYPPAFDSHLAAPLSVRPTPGISCEAVPAFGRGGAGMRRHRRLSAACGARFGAAESFVSFIPLFDGRPRS